MNQVWSLLEKEIPMEFNKRIVDEINQAEILCFDWLN